MATTTRPDRPATERGSGMIPPLRNGDHLTAAEFERRYRAMPDPRRAGLIEEAARRAEAQPPQQPQGERP